VIVRYITKCGFDIKAGFLHGKKCNGERGVMHLSACGVTILNCAPSSFQQLNRSESGSKAEKYTYYLSTGRQEDFAWFSSQEEVNDCNSSARFII
jgi:hypothetical protein